jgi:hypothetical protein
MQHRRADVYIVPENLQDVCTLAGDTVRKVGELQTDSHLERIRGWLRPPDPSTNFNQARALHHENTGQWFLDGEAYSKWKRCTRSLLWLNGIPGCGKTVLSSSVVDDLQQSAGPIRCVVYFYFDFNDVAKQHVESAVRSLIAQLYYQRREAREEVNALYSSCGKGAHQLNVAELRQLLLRMLQQAGEVWMILDAQLRQHTARLHTTSA